MSWQYWARDFSRRPHTHAKWYAGFVCVFSVNKHVVTLRHVNACMYIFAIECVLLGLRSAVELRRKANHYTFSECARVCVRLLTRHHTRINICANNIRHTQTHTRARTSILCCRRAGDTHTLCYYAECTCAHVC